MGKKNSKYFGNLIFLITFAAVLIQKQYTQRFHP